MKIVDNTVSVSLDQKVFPKNTLSHEVVGETVKIETVEGRKICDFKHFSEFKNSSSVAYTTAAGLDTALKAALYTAQA